MHSSITQSSAIAVNTTYVALDASNGLNTLASRITAGRVNLNTLATATINQSTALGLELARDKSAPDRKAPNGRVASNLRHSGLLKKREIVETTPANVESTPEMKLAVGCLYAYLASHRTYENALSIYTPSKPLGDDKFIAMMTDLGVKFSQHRVNQTIDLVRKADEIFTKLQSSGDLINSIYRDAAPDDKIPFLPATLSTPQLDAAMEMMHNAKKAHQKAKHFADMNVALKEILTIDFAVGNEKRLSSALSTLFKNVPMHSTISPILVKSLAVDNGFPLQNILGTFVKIHGWDELQSRLLDTVKKHMSSMHDIYLDEATSKQDEDRNRAAQASIQLVIKLTIAHLKPYMNNYRQALFPWQPCMH